MIFDTFYNKPTGTSIVIVVAPLTSLIKDQVESCINCGIKAVGVTSDEESYDAVIQGQFQIIYTSPEMLVGTRRWRATLENDMYQMRLNAIVIDEAHCVKKW